MSMRINPTEKQKIFLRAKKKYVAYGGARGGGKSWATRTKAVLLALKHGGIRILIIRRTFAELSENHIRPLRAITRDFANYYDGRKCFEFVNGSIIKMGYCDAESDVDQYQGQEYDVLFIDEATQLTEYQFSILKGCVRGINGFPKRMYLTCNPGGVGHGWVKRLFIDRDYKPNENPDDYEFIQSLVTDNKPLMENNPDYVNQLKELPESIRKAWLHGDWDCFEGQYFKEFDRNIHVCSPFEIPNDWRIYRSFDYGLDMLACLWIAVDYYGDVYVFKELCESGLIVSEAARKINDLSVEKVYETIAPPDMRSRQKDSGKTMRELFAENGVDVVIGDNSRVAGWLCLKEYLKPTLHGDGTTRPSLYIFDNCKTLIKSISNLMYDLKNPSDCATQPHEFTHAPDALRYFIGSRPLAPVVQTKLTQEQEFRNRIIKQYSRQNKRHGKVW